MLLVVGDTWCAVVDPLRYHTRISPVKSWVLIGTNWFIGFLFGIGSMFRNDCRQLNANNNNKNIIINSSFDSHELRTLHMYNDISGSSGSSNNNSGGGDGGTGGDSIGNNNNSDDDNNYLLPNLNISMFYYDLFYSWSFFILIVLLPLCIICIMYWNIFWEARQNGQRMRQNGSSPLLQSALNLATAPPQMPSISNINNLKSHNEIMQKRKLANGQTATGTRRNTFDASNIRINISEFSSIQMPNEIIHNQITDDVDQKHLSQYLKIPECTLNITSETDKQLGLNNNEINLNANDANSNQNKYDRKCDTKHCRQFHPHLIIQECAELLPKPKNNNNNLYQCLANNNYKNSQSNTHDLRNVHSSPSLDKLAHHDHSANKQLDDDKNGVDSDSVSIHELSNNNSSRSPSQSTTASIKALSYMSSIRHRLSNASSIFKYRAESRTARISILVIIIFLISYFPYGLLSFFHGQCRILAIASYVHRTTILEISLLLIANIGFPIIFAWRNKRLRNGVCRLIGIDTRKNHNTKLQIRNHSNNSNNNPNIGGNARGGDDGSAIGRQSINSNDIVCENSLVIKCHDDDKGDDSCLKSQNNLNEKITWDLK